MQTRYIKNLKSISEKEQEILWEKRVVIVGCGGLGQYVASELCRVGIGYITMIDRDTFEESNLNRQLYCHTQNLGKSKVYETEKQLRLINPKTHIQCIQAELAADTADLLIKSNDIVIDALDSMHYRLVLQKACKELNLPLISAAIGGWYGQLMVILPGNDTLNRLYMDENEIGIESELGNPAFTPAILASLQVSETVKHLLGKPTLKPNQVLYIDLWHMEFFKVDI